MYISSFFSIYLWEIGAIEMACAWIKYLCVLQFSEKLPKNPVVLDIGLLFGYVGYSGNCLMRFLWILGFRKRLEVPWISDLKDLTFWKCFGFQMFTHQKKQHYYKLFQHTKTQSNQKLKGLNPVNPTT